VASVFFQLRRSPRLRAGVAALPLCLCALLALALSPAADAKDDAFQAEKTRYEAYLERPSLYMRNRGREKFARTGDVRALEILARSYARPEEPKDQVRYLLASLCADGFQEAEDLPVLRAWRAQNTRPRDAWLWYRTLAVDHALEGAAPLVKAMRGGKSGILRMAALEALNTAKDDAVPALCTELLRASPGSPFEHGLLLRSAADTLLRTRSARAGSIWQDLARALLTAFDGEAVDEDTRLVVARRLAEVFETRTLYRTSTPWIALLEGRTPEATDEPPAEDVVRFLGMDATGTRIGYVIDLSDSMLEPVSVAELKDLAKLAELPWDKVISRFDAARELMRASLATLTPKQSFFVVTFGSEAKMLKATPGLRQATPGLVAKVMRELDAIVPGPAETGRPNGTLGGYTNLHGGLHRAFEVKGKTRVKQEEYVDPEAFHKGCDTIFLLSDGKPTWDDYPMLDTLEREDDPGDPETGYKSTNSKKATFYGPYARTMWLRDDLTRMNLFRRVEIHCVGLGEYDPHLLSWLARLGHGTLRRIGDGPEKAAKKKGK
jgi:hypothetical protein